MIKKILLLLLTTLVLAAPVRSQEADAPVLTEIHVSGNEKTDLGLIHHIMGLEIGQTLDMDQLDVAWDALEDSGHFRFVEMDYNDDDGETVVVTVMVEEDMSTYYGPRVEYSRRHKYKLGAWIEERNLRGKGETLRAEFSAFYIQDATLSWHRPWLFGVDGLDLTVKGFGEQADFVFRPTRYRKFDFDLEPKWWFKRPFYLLADARHGQFNQRDAFNWELPDRGPDSPEGKVRYDSGIDRHWLFRGGVGFDSRNNPYYPQRGVFVEAAAGRWVSDDFPSYIETSLDARFFVPMPWRKHVLALRGWGRQTDGPAHLDNMLYFGGPESIRGYPYASREGDEGYLLSAEYRMPLFLMPISPNGELVGFGFHLFTDAGDAWFEGAERPREHREVAVSVRGGADARGGMDVRVHG